MQFQIQQIYSTDEDLQCQRCQAKGTTFISLSCEHNFCVLCLSFMYVKHRKFDHNEGTVKCIKCQTITDLLPSHLEIVTKTLKEQLVPIIGGESQFTSKASYNKSRNSIDYRKIKSQQHSFDQNITPATAKYFYSKCQSPSSLKRDTSKPQCINHRQAITHICFDCSMQPLCLKCTSSSKKHSNHKVKDIQKSIQIINEQVHQTLLEIDERMQRLQLFQRRFQDRKLILKARTQQILKDIKISFANLHLKLKQKQQQIIQACKSNLDQQLSRNTIEMQQINESVNKYKCWMQKINKFQKQSHQLQYIYKWNEMKHDCTNNSPLYLQLEIENKIKFPNNSILEDINNLNTTIDRVNVYFKYTNLSRVGTSDELQNCKSQSKFKKDKRLKTNFVSLNSSREKKVKKNTKTEEDERRLRTQKANIEKQIRNNKMPAYITDYINKKGNKLGNNGNSLAVLQMTSPNIQNSKLSSKLLKTISPDQINYKKKDNIAIIKERIQRRTAQPTCKAKPQSGKKKKVH